LVQPLGKAGGKVNRVPILVKRPKYKKSNAQNLKSSGQGRFRGGNAQKKEEGGGKIMDEAARKGRGLP